MRPVHAIRTSENRAPCDLYGLSSKRDRAIFSIGLASLPTSTIASHFSLESWPLRVLIVHTYNSPVCLDSILFSFALSCGCWLLLMAVGEC